MTMAKCRRHPKTRPTDPRQSDFLALLARDHADLVPVPIPDTAPGPRPTGNLDHRLRRLLNEAIKLSRRSREDIASDMAGATGDSISAAMLNTWTGPSRTNAFPAKYLIPLVQALGPAGFHLLGELFAGSGYVALDEQWAAYARIGQMTVVAAAAQSEAARLAGTRPPAWSGRP